MRQRTIHCRHHPHPLLVVFCLVARDVEHSHDSDTLCLFGTGDFASLLVAGCLALQAKDLSGRKPLPSFSEQPGYYGNISFCSMVLLDDFHNVIATGAKRELENTSPKSRFDEDKFGGKEIKVPTKSSAVLWFFAFCGLSPGTHMGCEGHPS